MFRASREHSIVSDIDIDIDIDAEETLSSTSAYSIRNEAQCSSACDKDVRTTSTTSASSCSAKEVVPDTTAHAHAHTTHVHARSESKLPRIIFPSFPIRNVPAKTGAVLRWIAVQSTAILDGIKQHVANQDPQHLYAAPLPTDVETMEFLQGRDTDTPESESEPTSKSLSLLDVLHEEEVLLKLTNFDREECQRLTEDMRAFYDVRKAEQEENMMFAKYYSSDAIHPNDLGYDYFGRYLGKQIVQRWNVGVGEEDGIVGEGLDA
mmetsp:Transcript_4050/g.6182  ORF Transcript_4050/g.6182 Transcript_4050/m.6182 type:complete len:264 (-) Transcript_4050:222-1013(-)